MMWIEEVEGATQRKVQANVIEAGVKTNAGQVGAVGPADEMTKMWVELASQRRHINGRTGGGARPATSVDGINNHQASSLWPTSCPTPSSGGHCLLRLSPVGTHQKELPGSHGHFKIVASTPTIDHGVEEYERLGGGEARGECDFGTTNV